MTAQRAVSSRTASRCRGNNSSDEFWAGPTGPQSDSRRPSTRCHHDTSWTLRQALKMPALQCYGLDFLNSRQVISYNASVRWDNDSMAFAMFLAVFAVFAVKLRCVLRVSIQRPGIYARSAENPTGVRSVAEWRPYRSLNRRGLPRQSGGSPRTTPPGDSRCG